MPDRPSPTVPQPRPAPVAWGQAHLPSADDCWQRDLGTLRDVGRARAAVRRDLIGADLPEDDEEAAERMILGLDELASNGLRHGGPPVGLRVCTLPGHWLVDVTDSSPQVPPTPSPGRPAGQGGYGLYMVASYASAYGWVPEPHCKHVWALFPRR